MKQVMFYFDMYPEHVFRGFAAGGTWNGFDNVKVTVEEARRIDGSGLNLGEQISDVPPDAEGLLDLSNGYATTIER